MATTVEEILPTIDPQGLRRPRCRFRKSWSEIFENVRKYVATMATSQAGRRYTPTSGPSNSQASGQIPQSTTHPLPTRPTQQLPNPNVLNNPGSQQMVNSNHPSSTTKHWIVFGVQGSRPPLEVNNIGISQDTNDSAFYRLLRQSYRSGRGRIRLWFSLWTFGYCEVVRVRLSVR